MAHKKSIIGVQTRFGYGLHVSNIDHLDLIVSELEFRKELFGIPIYSKRFNAVSVVIESQCNRDDNSHWYGFRIKTECQSEGELQRATSLCRKILKEVHSTYTNCRPYLERVYDMFTPVCYDSRVSDYVLRQDVEALEDVRGWIDLRPERNHCTVNAYTRYKDPTPEQIREAIKNEMCLHGYADQLVKWVNNGMPYEEMYRGQESKANPIPPKFYLDYPTTKVKPEDAWAELNRKTA